jgi:hypothetical protein
MSLNTHHRRGSESAERSRPPRDWSRGAALLETMLVAPVFMVVVLGIFEFGLVYRDVLTVSDAVGDAARLGAVIGPRPTIAGSADYEIVRAINDGLGRIPVEWVERIVVFRGGPPGSGSGLEQVPAPCRTGPSVPGLCNVYDPANAFLAVRDNVPEYFTNCGHCAWPPSSRSNGPSSFDIDYLGVYVRIARPYVTGLFGDRFTIDQVMVVRLEPGILEED